MAIGWYFLGILILSILIITIWWYISLRHKPIEEINHILTNLESRSAHENSEEILAEISILLKRIAIMRFPQQNPHALFGEKWLAFLDSTGKTTSFTSGHGRALLDSYQKKPLQNRDELFSLIKQWIRIVL